MARGWRQHRQLRVSTAPTDAGDADQSTASRPSMAPASAYVRSPAAQDASSVRRANGTADFWTRTRTCSELCRENVLREATPHFELTRAAQCCPTRRAALSGMLKLVRGLASRLSTPEGRAGLEASAAAARSCVSAHGTATRHLVTLRAPDRAQAWHAAARRLCAAAATPEPLAANGNGTTAPPQQEYYVYACAFMLSSSLDLGKLKPQLSDVLHDSGKDYLVLSFRPSPNRFQRVPPPRRFLPRTDGSHPAPGTNVPGALRVQRWCSMRRTSVQAAWPARTLSRTRSAPPHALCAGLLH